MSQHRTDMHYGAPTSSTNGLGIAGFIVSLVGLLICGGFLSPVGLVMSLIALGRRPKGFAIAGVVLGVIGSIWFFLLVFVIGIGTVLAAVGIGVAVIAAARMGENAVKLNQAIEEYHKQNGRVPAALTDLASMQTETLQDPWGTPFRYEVTEGGAGFYLRSDGPDRAPGTSDDIELWRRLGPDEDFKLNIGERSGAAEASPTPAELPDATDPGVEAPAPTPTPAPQSETPTP